VIVDNNSTDSSKEMLINLAKTNKKLKIILNDKNYQVLPSLFNALRFVNGEGILICYSADLQDDIKTLKLFISKWEKGYDLVSAQRNIRNESSTWKFIKKIYYFLYILFNSSEIIRKKKHYFVNVFLFADISLVKKIIKNFKTIYPHIPSMLYTQARKIYSFKNIKWLDRKKGKSANTLFNYFIEAFLILFSFTSLFKIIFSIVFLLTSIFLYSLIDNFSILLNFIIGILFVVIFNFIKNIINTSYDMKKYKIKKKINL